MYYLEPVSRLQSPVLGAALAGLGFIFLSVSTDGAFAHTRPIPDIPVFVALALLSMPVHELVHAFGFTAGSRPARAVEFGWSLWPLQLHMAVRSPLPVWRFRLGVLLPALVLGAAPLIGAALTGVPVLGLLAVACLSGCGNDLLVAWSTRGTPDRSTITMDGIGFLVAPGPAH